MRFTLVIIGMIFLFNPVANVLDPLPDFIGYIFIIAGLSRISCLVDMLDDARTMFKRLAVITGVKLASSLLLALGNDTLMLVIVFSFAVIELMCLYPAFDRFFDGLLYAGTRNGGTAVFKSKTKRIRLTAEKAKQLVLSGKTNVIEETSADGSVRYYSVKTVDRVNAVRSYTLFFMTAKLVINVLPELTALQLYDNVGAVTQNALNYSQFKPMLYVLSWILTLIIAVPWLVLIISYLASVVRDKQFMANLKERYLAEIVPDKTRAIVNSMTSVLVLVGIAVVLTFDLYIEHVNVTPNFFAALFMLAAFAVMTRYNKLSIVGIVSSVCWGGISAFNLLRQTEYFDRYTVRMMFTNREAAEMYENLEYIQIAEAIAGAVTYIVLAVVLIKVVGKHISLIGADRPSIPGVDKNADIRFTVTSRTTAIAVLAVISSAASAFYTALVPDFEFAFPIMAGIELVMITYALFSLFTVNDEVYKRLRGDY